MTAKKKHEPEGLLVAAVIQALRAGGCVAWRQNNLPSFTVIKRMQPGTALVRLHRANVLKGIADVGGVAPCGRAIQVECKRPGEKPSPEQRAWLTTIAASGGIAVLCFDVAQMVMLINEARLVGWDRVPSPHSSQPSTGGNPQKWSRT